MSSFSPLPHLDWADTHDMWSHLHKKEERYYRDTEMFDNHPEILAYMRAILLGWLTEVQQMRGLGAAVNIQHTHCVGDAWCNVDLFAFTLWV